MTMRRFAIALLVLAVAVESRASVSPETAAWIRNAAIPLQTVEAGHGFADMEPLRAVVGNARIVALGEATHGTREFFQLKHRMLEFLVERMGFTVFAIEASSPDAEAVNDYVLTGKGDPAAALAGLGFWTWNTDEVLDLIKWMRRYNEDPAHAKKLKFYGFDMQAPQHSETRLRKYFETVDPEHAKEPVAALTSLLESHRAEYAARSSAAAWELARHHARLIEQAKMKSNEGRDRAMAENVKWILDHEPAGTKIVLWAHNYHVSTTPDRRPMGTSLRSMYGDAMRIFIFAFGRGDFNAVNGPSLRGLTKHTALMAPPSSFDGALAENGPPIFALDLRSARGKARVWIDSKIAHRSAGAVYDDARPEKYFDFVQPSKLADAVLFVRETTASHLRGGAGLSTPMPPPARSAVNLAFDEGTPGQEPPGWHLNGSARDAYRARVTADGCARGTCAVVERAEGDQGFGGIMQRIDATPYRGKKVRFRAKIRSALANAESDARLWLRVDLPQGKMGFFDNMASRPLHAQPEWKEVEIVGDVDPSAEGIAFGLLFIGGGTAWIDEASLDVVP